MLLELSRCTFDPVLSATALHLCTAEPFSVLGGTTHPVNSDVRWTVPAADSGSASSVTISPNVPLDLTVSANQSAELDLFLAPRLLLGGDGDPVTRLAINYVTDGGTDAPIPVPAIVSCAPFCNEDWIVQVHKDQLYITITRKKPVAEVTTLPSLVVVAGSYLPLAVTATLVSLTATAATCDPVLTQDAVVVVETSTQCVPCCQTATPDFTSTVGVQAGSFRTLPTSCPPCGWPKGRCGTKPLPVGRRVRYGSWGPLACPVPGSRKCCTTVVPVVPCVPGQVLTLVDYYMTATLGGCCGTPWYFPRTGDPGPTGSPVVLASSGGYESTVTFAWAEDPAASVPIASDMALDVFVYHTQVSWHRYDIVAEGAAGEFTFRYYVLVWGTPPGVFTKPSRLTTVVNGTSCEGDPILGCGGVAQLRPAGVYPGISGLCSSVNTDLNPDMPYPPMMTFLVGRDVALLHSLPAGSIIFCCYNDLVLTNLDVSAFFPITWCLQASPDTSDLMAVTGC